MGRGLFEMSRWRDNLCLLIITLVEGCTHLVDVHVSEVFEEAVNVEGREQRSTIITSSARLDTVPTRVLVDTVVTA